VAKIWRRKIRGKRTGTFYVTLDGERINLESTSPVEAERHARAAARGDYSWRKPPDVHEFDINAPDEELDDAAAAVEASRDVAHDVATPEAAPAAVATPEVAPRGATPPAVAPAASENAPAPAPVAAEVFPTIDEARAAPAVPQAALPGVPVAPAAAVNEEAGAAPAAAAGAPEPERPTVKIPAALFRAGAAGVLSWLSDKGAAWSLRRFGPRGKDGKRFRPGPSSIPVDEALLKALGVPEKDRRELGVTPEAGIEWPVGEVLAEGVNVELERLGLTRDIAIHPVIVIVAGIIAIPAVMVIRSPDLQNDDDEAAPPLRRADADGSVDATG